MKIPKKPIDCKDTASQWEAEHANGQNILVSASAGSGKTYVLTKRIIIKLYQGININELLILTFTRKAAQEMKERIEKAIKDEITKLNSKSSELTQQDINNLRHFKKQLHLIKSAWITTIDSFCNQIINKYYYIIKDLKPKYRMLNSELTYDKELIQEKVFQKLMSQLYQQEDPKEFYQLIDWLTIGNISDDTLLDILNKIVEEASIQENPIQWIKSLNQAYHLDEELVAAQDWDQAYQNNLVVQEFILPRLNQFYEQNKHYPEYMDNQDDKLFTDSLVNFNQDITSILYDIKAKSWQQVIQSFQTLKPPILRGEKKEFFNNIIKEFPYLSKEYINNHIKQFLSETPQEFCEHCLEISQYVNQLVKLALEYYQMYQAEKLKLSQFEYSDIELLAYQILKSKINDNKTVGDYYKEQIVEIMIDEYQDNNALQDAILNQLSRGNNIFMVGDIKQSIYGFRKANPMLFKEKYDRYQNTEDGYLIVLQENFRSQNNILNFTNYIFKQLMSEPYGQINYDKQAELICGTDQQKKDILPTEILIYETKPDTKEISEHEQHIINKINNGSLEVLANKIKKLHNQGVEYNQITILVKNKSENQNIKKVLSSYQIPVQLTDIPNYFKTTELKTMIALLNIIDNPMQDIHLFAVLRSMIVQLNENDFIELYNYKNQEGNQSLTYYEVLLKLSRVEDDKPLVNKIKYFVNQLNHWRQKQKFMTLSDFIWLLYEETGFFEYVGGLENGNQRQANLQALYHRAKAYEDSIGNKISKLVKLINESVEKSEDLNEINLVSNPNSVQVMTIHKSKGLEFDYVFIYGLSSKGQNNTDRILCNSVSQVAKIPFAIKYYHRQENKESLLPDYVKTDNLVFNYLNEQIKAQQYAENMRLLYVALTRAKKQIFLMLNVDNLQKIQEDIELNLANKELTFSEEMHNKSNIVNWIISALGRHPDMYQYFDKDSKDNQILLSNKEKLDRFIEDNNLIVESYNDLIIMDQLKHKTLENNEQLQVDVVNNLTKDQLKQAHHILNYNYPYQFETQTSSYQSVSEIKQIFADPALEELITINSQSNPERKYVNSDFKNPNFLTENENKIKDNERGQIIHRLLQLLDLSQPITMENLQQTAKMIADPDLINKFNYQAIINFFKTDLGQLIIDNRDDFYREQAFSMLMEAKQIFTDIKTNDNQVLIHGIIDAYLELEDEIIIIDYKNSYPKSLETKEEFITRLKMSYSGQLNLYKKALAYKEKTIKAYLVVLPTTDIIEVDQNE